MRLELTPHQAKAFESVKPVIALVSGTGAGKTYLSARWIVLKALELSGEHLAVSPTFPMLKKTLWHEIKRFLLAHSIPHEKNEQDMVLRFTNGAFIYGISADKPERMEGIHASSAVMDEAGQMDYTAWETVRRRVAFKSGQILISSTPYRWNWLKTEIHDAGIAGSDEIELINVSSIENPWYPMDRFEHAKASLPDWRFKMFYLGQFTRPLGIIYPDCKITAPFEVPADWTRLRGVDFGFNNPAAIVWIARSHAGNQDCWYVYREYKASGMTLDEMRAVLAGERDIITYADPASKGELETLRRWGINIRPARKDVLPGITYLQGLMKQEKLQVFSSLKKMIDELNSYSWALDKNDDPLDDPEKKNDHLLDALRYALFTSQKQESISIGMGTRIISTPARHALR